MRINEMENNYNVGSLRVGCDRPTCIVVQNAMWEKCLKWVYCGGMVVPDPPQITRCVVRYVASNISPVRLRQSRPVSSVGYAYVCVVSSSLNCYLGKKPIGVQRGSSDAERYILGCSQAARHQTLTLAFVSSNLTVPAMTSCCVFQEGILHLQIFTCSLQLFIKNHLPFFTVAQ